jgi:hypothetical protein
MAFDPVTALINLGSTVIDRVLPDKPANDAAKAQLLQMQTSGALDAEVEQAKIDQVEAASNSIFVAGWRPFVGWVCGTAFAYAFILQPFIVTVATLAHSTFDVSKLPTLDLAEMMPVLLGMLGLGAARTVEKINGVNSGH